MSDLPQITTKSLRDAIAAEDCSRISAALDAGLDPFQRDENGLDCFDFAREVASEDVFNFLINAYAERESRVRKDFSESSVRVSAKKRGELSALTTEVSIEEFESNDLFIDELSEIACLFDLNSIRNIHDPREYESESYDYEEAQNFGKPSQISNDDWGVFFSDLPALRCGTDIQDAFELCEQHILGLADKQKQVLSLYLFASGGDASLFLRFTEKTEERLRRLKSITPDYVEQICNELDQAFDPSIKELFCLLATDDYTTATNQKELTVALFIALVKKIFDRRQFD